MYEEVTKAHFLNDIDEVIVYIRAYLDGAKVDENEIYPVMGEYVEVFGDLLENKEIKLIGSWISQAVIYKLPIEIKYRYQPSERFTYNEYTKKVIFRSLYPLLDFFNKFYNQYGMSLEDAVASIKSRLLGNIDALEKEATYVLKDQINYFIKQVSK